MLTHHDRAYSGTVFYRVVRGHGGEVGRSNPGPDVGNLVVAYWWSEVYSTEPWHQLYVLASSAHKTTRHDMPSTVL